MHFWNGCLRGQQEVAFDFCERSRRLDRGEAARCGSVVVERHAAAVGTQVAVDDADVACAGDCATGETTQVGIQYILESRGGSRRFIERQVVDDGGVQRDLVVVLRVAEETLVASIHRDLRITVCDAEGIERHVVHRHVEVVHHQQGFGGVERGQRSLCRSVSGICGVTQLQGIQVAARHKLVLAIVVGIDRIPREATR